jgi:DNA-directed RNA polymerase sigma subunit (sigma70/sigma32)
MGNLSRERIRQIKQKNLRILRSELMMMDEEMFMLFK